MVFSSFAKILVNQTLQIMRIKEIIRQFRRDFTAIYQCEHCEYELEDNGYDDERFHTKVIPSMKCPECGKVSPENYRPLTTKYDKNMVI